MSTSSNVIAGSLVLQEQPELTCFTSFVDVLKAIPQFLGVEIPVSYITNVIVGPEQPSSSQTNSIWFRMDNSGSFLGIYVFSAGAWRQIYPLSTSKLKQIFWISSIDYSVPAGFTKIDGSTPTSVIPATVNAALVAQYVNDGTDDIYYAAYFSGF